VELARLGIQKAPNYPMAHRALASALGQLGLIEEGRRALERFMQLAPNYTTESAKRTARLTPQVDFEHYMEDLRKLGWDR
jgi:hypothetical protein